MKIPLQFMTKRKVREALLYAETEARLRAPDQQVEKPDWQLPPDSGPSMTVQEGVRYRRLMAMLHYGESTANLEYEALLTEGEKEYLDAYIIQQRWARFLME